MIFIRSLLFNIFFLIWCAIISVIFIPLLPLSNIRVNLGRFWAKGIMLALKYIANINYEIRGQENIPKEPCIFASKHQSAWDTAIFFLILPKISYILKKELTKIPVYGLYLTKIGMIAVDRKAGASALKYLLKETESKIRQGFYVVIFPEGTRKEVGAEPAYHAGVAALYSNKNISAKIVPVALNSGKFWARNSFLKYPGTIIIEFLPAMEPGLKREQFMTKLEQLIEGGCKKLN